MRLPFYRPRCSLHVPIGEQGGMRRAALMRTSTYMRIAFLAAIACARLTALMT